MPLNIPTASSAQDLNARLQRFREGVAFVTEPLALNEVDRAAREEDTTNSSRGLWRTHTITGNIGRGDGLFFEVQGVRVRPNGPTDNMHYFQPIVRERPPGVPGNVCSRDSSTTSK